jgi:protease II
LGKRPSKAGALMKEASADSYIGQKTPSFYIQNGTVDPLIPLWHVEDFYRKLNAVPDKGDLVLDVLEGAGHAGGGIEFFEEANIMGYVNFFKAHIACRPDG